jgi:hypothetical protein
MNIEEIKKALENIGVNKVTDVRRAYFQYEAPNFVEFLLDEVNKLKAENEGLKNTIAQMQDAEDNVKESES